MDHIRNNPRVQILLSRTDDYLEKIGFTEHGIRHASLVSRIAFNLLHRLDYPIRDQKLAEIAGYLHDIGNCINRVGHAQTGAMIAYSILKDLDFKDEDIIDVCGAIGNHHEEDGKPVSFISAALILADKADVHKTRVKKNGDIKADIHDRVNFAVEESKLVVKRPGLISLNLQIDTKISSPMEYLEIFMARMLMSRKAAEFLSCDFEIYINENRLL